MNNLTITPGKSFEDSKQQQSGHGAEYWSARDLMPLLGYTQWKNFEEVIAKAQAACANSGQSVKDHFADVGKMIVIAAGTLIR